ncbi:xanthine dehydrogenase small subunit [Pusillimonas sp.]|uniref:xanthine dehydrogenase small subunit n=1 Tax=Pusillimonas sp. TaxID=3040095 RepID=UPI0037CB4BBF
MRKAIEFLFNGELRRLADFDPNMTVLRYIREVERAMGSKEGCAEGDCGACTAVVVEQDDGALRYRAVNSCIQLLGTLDGKALLTVESLKHSGQLHRAQKAMVAEHGSQCGFCTPGFVMSIFAGVQHEVQPTRQAIDELLAGNLCRCTGYTPIINAAKNALQAGADGEWAARSDELLNKLKALSSNTGARVGVQRDAFVIPRSVEELAAYLVEHPDAALVAGGTDLGVHITKNHKQYECLVYLGCIPELKQIEVLPEGVRLGAAVTYDAARKPLAELAPSIGQLISRIGAVQVRNLGTIGGNIGNGSPIGDMPPALIAAGAELTLRRGAQARKIALEDYFIAYGRQDINPGEFIESIWIPRPSPSSVLKVYKVSKRIEQDISGVCGAFNLEFDSTADEITVAKARICFGGMAGTPLRAEACEQFLTGRAWTDETVARAREILENTYEPLSDARASSIYRNRLAGNLLHRYFLECQTSSEVGVVAAQV